MATQQRDVVLALSPPWLATGNNERYMYTLGLSLDVLLEKLNQAMRAHMPGQGTATALPYIGLDRNMPQGPFESDDDYALRLTKAYDAWQRAGTRRAVLGQALTYLGLSTQAVEGTAQVPTGVIVSTSSAGTYAVWDWYYNTSDVDQEPNHKRVAPANWNWDGDYTWWRAWLIAFLPASHAVQPGPVFGAAGVVIGDEDLSIGFTYPASFFTAYRALVKLWKSANTYYPWLIFSFDVNDGGTGDDYSPNSVLGTGNPNGTYGRWGVTVAGIVTASRPDDSRFVDGPATYLNCYTPTST